MVTSTTEEDSATILQGRVTIPIYTAAVPDGRDRFTASDETSSKAMSSSLNVRPKHARDVGDLRGVGSPKIQVFQFDAYIHWGSRLHPRMTESLKLGCLKQTLRYDRLVDLTFNLSLNLLVWRSTLDTWAQKRLWIPLVSPT